ncbi:MAG TPA: prenyltransferase/squalene oxidase repeat-containing protein [Kofleriaceae bacterium]|nr:prenyltransferase/squalene oxidase repeat-containing protein [Kofleriaceae bacterium]
MRTLAVVLSLATFGCGAHKSKDQGRGDPIVVRDPGGGSGSGSGSVAVQVRARGDVKPLSQTIDKGLDWLAKHQLSAGGWGQGDEAAGMGHGMDGMRDAANVADTSMALLAFLRAGHTPNKGAHRDAVNKGLEYVLAEVENSDSDSMMVSTVTGTRVQAKIGPYADTFAALLVLSEARGTMRDGPANARLDKALKKVVKKIEKNQRQDGTWEGGGWAPVLSQALAAKGMNRAAQRGIAVSEVTLDRLEDQAHSQVNLQTNTFAADSAAGVGLYGGAAATAAARDTATTRKAKAEGMKAQRANAGNANETPKVPTQAEVAAAEARAVESDGAAAKVEGALIANLGNDQFIAGFGNNGGEEFLSYMMISESLVAKGGDEWAKWDAQITTLVNKVQNEDGSWSGHHCITGRTFCTAAALLVLMGDRTPMALEIAG